MFQRLLEQSKILEKDQLLLRSDYFHHITGDMAIQFNYLLYRKILIEAKVDASREKQLFFEQCRLFKNLNIQHKMGHFKKQMVSSGYKFEVTQFYYFVISGKVVITCFR